MKNAFLLLTILAVICLQACAGFERGCSSSCADSLGADWIVVQYNMSGDPYRCWVLESVSISNEAQSDGIYWLASSGNLVHISGTYNRVQVEGEKWNQGFAEVGLTRESCEAIHARVYSVEGSNYQ